MGTKQSTCFTAVCDDCGTEYEHDYTPHWPSEAEAADDAVGSAEWWLSDSGVLLCDDCKLKPHDYVASALLADLCDRCEIPEDEHGPDGGDVR
jgi:hypothetical protein